MQRRLCAAILTLESVMFGLTTPVLITVAQVPTATALWVGLGLCVAALVITGLLRFAWAMWLGWALQFAAIGLGVVVNTMIPLGLIFLALWATAYFMGARIESDRAAWLAAAQEQDSHP